MSEKEKDEILEEENLNSISTEDISENEVEEENDAVEEKKEETCEEKIMKLELEIQEWKNSYTRKLAEFQNLTKRK